MLAKENKTLHQLVEEIKDFAGCEFFTDRIDIELESDEKAQNTIDEFSKMETIANLSIKEKLELDGLKLFLDNGLTTLLIRKSGTEPLLRFYVESETEERLEEVKKFIQSQIL